MRLDPDDLRSWAGIGVAGNFAGHLEQAGEAGDFLAVEAAADAPKGIFPFYLPGHDSFLSTFPLSATEIVAPGAGDEDDRLQIEPEVALACEIAYAIDGRVEALRPLAFGAFNDCSLRRQAARISQKKNWGTASKGVAEELIPLDGNDLETGTAHHRLACFLRRDGELHSYGIDSPLSGYSYFGQRLLDWVVERLNGQKGGEGTPLEPVGAYLDACGRPTRVLLAIGATRYTPYGESTFLRTGDETIVAVYDARRGGPETATSVLRQQVRAARAPALS